MSKKGGGQLLKVQRTIIVAALAAMTGQADTVVLRTGQTLTGSFLGGDNRTIRFVVDAQVFTYSLSDVVSLGFAPMPGAAAAAGQQPVAAPGEGRGGFRAAGTAPGDARFGAGKITVPSGQALDVRLIDPIDSTKDQPGQTYRASLDAPIYVSGQAVAPRGADVTVELTDAEKAGRFTGRTQLKLALTSLTIGGRSYDMATSDVVESSGARGGQSAGSIVGGTGLGAIIGGLAGGWAWGGYRKRRRRCGRNGNRRVPGWLEGEGAGGNAPEVLSEAGI